MSKNTKKMIVICLLLFSSLLWPLNFTIPVFAKAQESTQIESTALVSSQVVDENGKFIIATILVNNLDKNSRTTLFTDLTGRFELELPKANYELTFQRDGLYEQYTIPLEIRSRIPQELGEIPLHSLINLTELGWYGGDLHQHSFNSDGQDSPFELLVANLAAGCNFGMLSDHNTVDGLAEFLSLNKSLLTSHQFLALGGVEVTTPAKGHFNVINTAQIYPFELESEEEFKNSIQSAKSSDHFIQINHPSRRDILGFAFWDLISEFEGIEIWNGKDLPPLFATNLSAKEKMV